MYIYMYVHIYHVQHFNTPLHSAIKTYNRPEHLRIVEALLEHGAPPDVFDEVYFLRKNYVHELFRQVSCECTM